MSISGSAKRLSDSPAGGREIIEDMFAVLKYGLLIGIPGALVAALTPAERAESVDPMKALPAA